ncbi:hypothetical protein [Desulforhopalus singaporensis]|uniref:Uncharacterized protein n=1 Tax=Desulforhopalus singaporensis TaxID=91360 RepID=A0A1H0LKP5_9BACT|nr:hypothetical protein [Desulforhopalus singaporensis]SDO68561.1 hypothetical protein SAMN05660330_00832 [Desulforhopalus singaporensis]
MNLEELKTTILNLDHQQQKQLMMEILPQMLPQFCTDDACLDLIRKFSNDESIKSYREQHMDGI